MLKSKQTLNLITLANKNWYTCIKCHSYKIDTKKKTNYKTKQNKNNQTIF